MISRETIDEVKNRIDIVDVISDFITLKRSGQNYKALSPFNNEKTPSFFVVPAKGIFKDFSSGKGGDAITFVMEHEGMGYLEAIRFLAKKYGVEIKEEAGSEAAREQQSEREGLYILMSFAKDYYKHNLFETEEGQGIGLSYFRERGFHDRTIQKFELGYALDGWSHLMDEAIRRNYNKDLLEKTGLVVRNEEGRTYDRFRGRVIFPVHNLTGKVIAFGARMMGKEKNQPKYINSPETDIYHKGQVLYGLYHAKNSIRQRDACYLVEGYTDVLSMHQADVENVVASSGTALTDDQIKLIRRFTDNVTVLFDGDAAGIKAALRGIDLILKGGLNVRVVLLPDGEDPDSYSRKVGTAEFQKYLATKTQDFISFKSGLYASEAGNDPIRKAESIKEIIGSIALIPDPVKRSVYLQETSHQLRIGEPVLLTELNKLLVQERRKRERDRQDEVPPELDNSLERIQETTVQSVDPAERVYYQEKEAVRLLINHAEKVLNNEQTLADFLRDELSDVEFLHPVFKEIFQTIQRNLSNGDSIQTKLLIDQLGEEAKKVITDLVTLKYSISPNWQEKSHIHVPGESDTLDQAAYQNVMRFKFFLLQKMVEDTLGNIKVAEGEDSIEKLDTLFTHLQYLKKAENEIADVLGIVVAR